MQRSGTCLPCLFALCGFFFSFFIASLRFLFTAALLCFYGDGLRHVFITGSRLQLTPTRDGSHFQGEERLTKRTCGTMSGLKTAKEKSGNILFRRKCSQAWKKCEPAGWWEWDSKEHGLNGRLFCKGCSPGQTSAKQTSIVSGSSFRLSMMSYQVQPTSTSGAKLKHQPVPNVQDGDPWNTSSAAARKPL